MKKHRSRNKARFRTKDKNLFQNNIFNRDAHVIPEVIHWHDMLWHLDEVWWLKKYALFILIFCLGSCSSLECHSWAHSPFFLSCQHFNLPTAGISALDFVCSKDPKHQGLSSSPCKNHAFWTDVCDSRC